MPAEKKKVLFICTHNSARSQMAEALLNSLHGEKYQAFSAGTEPGKLNPYAVKAMAELGLDISGNRTKNVKEFLGTKFDFIVTVCGNARETCPFFPGALKYIHMGFQDPSSLEGGDEEVMEKVREIRDEIRDWIKHTFSEE